MNTVYNDTTHEEKSQIEVEEIAIDFTTPEDILLAWEGIKALRKREKEVPTMDWQEFLSWMTGR
jgi:hypothetical protein